MTVTNPSNLAPSKSWSTAVSLAINLYVLSGVVLIVGGVLMQLGIFARSHAGEVLSIYAMLLTMTYVFLTATVGVIHDFFEKLVFLIAGFGILFVVNNAEILEDMMRGQSTVVLAFPEWGFLTVWVMGPVGCMVGLAKAGRLKK
jgi:hypothetical protein